jgi:hypothetical protein
VPKKPANSGVQARHTSSSRVSLESTSACTTDLADELEHVERAGLGQVHHNGAVHDEQAPAPASSSHGACAGHNLVPQQQCSTKQMASKLATSSSSNAVVGQKVARSTAEPTSPYRRRHGRRERARQRRIASARIYLYLTHGTRDSRLVVGLSFDYVFGQNVTEHNSAPSPSGHPLLSGPPTLDIR